MTDPMSRLAQQEASEERARIEEMRCDAIWMVQEMPPEALEAWFPGAFPAMDAAATSKRSISNVDPSQDTFEEIPF